jgi:hypothetical protein
MNMTTRLNDKNDNTKRGSWKRHSNRSERRCMFSGTWQSESL